MSVERNKDLARHFFAALDRADLAAVDQLTAPGYTGHFSGSPTPLDREGFKGFATTFFTAFPGIQHGIDDVIAEGDRVVVRLTARGVHRGDLMGMPPTGKDVAIDAINVLRVADDKVAEQWALLDMAGLMQQLGAATDPTQTVG